MAYTCRYPINYEISVGETGISDYEITLDGDIIYTTVCTPSIVEVQTALTV